MIPEGGCVYMPVAAPNRFTDISWSGYLTITTLTLWLSVCLTNGRHFKKSVKQGPNCGHWVDKKKWFILTCFIESVLPIFWIMHCTVLFFRVKENVRKPFLFSTKKILTPSSLCENDLETLIILHYICCLVCSLGHLIISPKQWNVLLRTQIQKQTTFKNIDRLQAFLHSRALCVPRLSTITRVSSNLASRPCGYRSVHLQWLWQA